VFFFLFKVKTDKEPNILISFIAIYISCLELRNRVVSSANYGISVSQMTTDMFHLSESLSSPFLIHDLSPGL
jgi:hypothetical protein